VTGVTILQGDGALAVEIKHARDSDTGVLRWDQPPSLRRVAEVLLAHLARSITSLGDLDTPGFYGSELRHHARRLLDGGDVRGEWLALVRSEPGVGPRVPTTVIAPEPDALCSLCDERSPSGLPPARWAGPSTARGMSSDLARGAGSPPLTPGSQAQLTAGRCAALVTSGRNRELVMGRAVCDCRLEAVTTVLIDRYGAPDEVVRAVLTFPTSGA
jgi:hypothetical protein